MGRRNFLGWLALALATAGCQHTPRPALDLFSAGSERSPKLSKGQAADVQIALGRSLEKRGELDQAVATYREAVKRDPQRSDAYLRLAILHDQHGKFKESGEYYRAALKVDPSNPEVHCNLGYSCYLQQRWEEAESHLRKALELNPDDPSAHSNLALVLARTERFDEAFAEFRRGGCDESQAHSNLGFVLALDHRWQEARAQYTRALDLNPGLQTARHDLQAMNDLLAKYPSASEGGASTVQLTSFQEPAR